MRAAETETVERLAPTGTKLPVWYRLPDRPPLASYDEPPGDDEDTLETDPTVTDPAYAPPPDPGAPRPDLGQAAPLAPVTAPPHRGSWPQTIVAAVLGAALALGGSALLSGDDTPTVVTTAPRTTAAPTPDRAEDTAAIAAAVVPSIVTVMVGNETGDGLLPIGSGSGVIISADGLIVTNDHVVQGAPEYQVVLSDGRTSYPATLIGTDPLTDLAVLKIEATGLEPITLGSTETLRVGDGALAVGSPLGLQGGPSVTVGVVSAFGRQVTVGQGDTLFGMLQTDAPITEGSSGGALVDTSGHLIGITTAVGVSNVGVEGIGFATPVELMRRIVDELVAEGSVDHALLGIRGATAFGTSPDGAQVAAGVQIESVEAGTAAADAGLRAGDIITSADGEPIKTMDELVIALRHQSAGDTLTLTIAPSVGETTRNVEVTLGQL